MIGHVDQFQIPWAYAVGQDGERVLHIEEWEAWAGERALRCGHADPVVACKLCQGTQAVAGAFSSGSAAVRVFPAR